MTPAADVYSMGVVLSEACEGNARVVRLSSACREGAAWDRPTMREVHDALREVARDVLGRK